MRPDLPKVQAFGVLFFMTAALTVPLPAQLLPTMDGADELFEAGSWAAAAEAYRTVLETEPANARAWYQLGLALRRLERFDEAILALENAVELDFQPLRSLPSLAVTQADAQRTDDAFATLERAVEAGLPAAVLGENPAFEALRGDERFAALVAVAEARARPCESDPRYAALDFWIGAWEVRSKGQTVGRSRVTRRQRGCVVHESWTSPSGTGESVNYFNPKTGQWEQLWVDEHGDVVWYAGGPRGGGLYLVGEHIRTDGTVTPARVTLEPLDDGTLRHRVEHSSDGAWFTWFDAIYVPETQEER